MRNNFNCVKEIINMDFSNVYSWLCANKLSLNIAKTNCMLICNYQKVRFLPTTELNISIEGQTLEQVKNCKYLGLMIDQHLDFNTNTEQLVSKLNRSIGTLKYCSKYLSKNTLISLYNSIVLPHFDYCSTVWSNTSGENITRLQRIQNRGMCIILKAGPRTHIEDMMNALCPSWSSLLS